MTDLTAARANLADAEAELTAGTNPYAAANVATHRARVARMEAATVPVATAAPVPAATPVPATPATPSGTREKRLERLAQAFGADDATLARAIADGTSPDDFAALVAGESAETVALAIAASNQPASKPAAPEVEALVSEILAA